jgi:hypothetical protein
MQIPKQLIEFKDIKKRKKEKKPNKKEAQSNEGSQEISRHIVP